MPILKNKNPSKKNLRLRLSHVLNSVLWHFYLFLKIQHGFSLVSLCAEFYCTGSTTSRLSKQGCAQGKTDMVKKICVASQNLMRLVWASSSQNKTVVQGQEF